MEEANLGRLKAMVEALEGKVEGAVDKVGGLRLKLNTRGDER